MTDLIDTYSLRPFAPHLVLDRAPTAVELLKARHRIVRDRLLGLRDGRLVCSIPIECEYEVRSLTEDVFFPVRMYSERAYGDKDPNEIGQLVGWRIVVRCDA